MTEFKVGDTVKFKDSRGDGQHWSVPNMIGTVVETNVSPMGNMRVEVVSANGIRRTGEFRPQRWELVEEASPKKLTIDDAYRLIALSEEIADKTQELNMIQSELAKAQSEYEELAYKLNIK